VITRRGIQREARLDEEFRQFATARSISFLAFERSIWREAGVFKLSLARLCRTYGARVFLMLPTLAASVANAPSPQGGLGSVAPAALAVSQLGGQINADEHR
jgi:hypothetical protein